MELDKEEQSKPKTLRRKEIIKQRGRINNIKSYRENQISDTVKKIN